MPALFTFLIKVNIALLLFGAGYYLVLRHLTFYTLNRVYLMAVIVFASVYPLINLHSFAERHQQLTRPVQVIILNFQSPARALLTPVARPDYWHWAALVFWLGAGIFAIRLAVQLFSLFQLHRASKPGTINNQRVRVISSDAGPFSFWRSIYVNPDNHQPADLQAILLHEQVHVNQWHTLDILLAELSTIFYWFNPGIWLMKKAVRENIEFITDRKLLTNGLDSKQYQYSLVNVSFSAPQHTLVNNFNLSTIKKRIIMMNAQRSSHLNLTRYLFLVPIVLICVLSFSITRAAIIKKSKSVYKSISLSVAKTSTAFPTNVQLTTTIKPVSHPRKALTDTAKSSKTVSISYGLQASTDTGKNIEFGNALHSKTYFSYLQDDTAKKINFPTPNVINRAHMKDTLVKLLMTGKGTKIIMVDGRLVKTDELKTIPPADILLMQVKQMPDDTTIFVVTTTKNTNATTLNNVNTKFKMLTGTGLNQPITKVTVNGKVLTALQLNGLSVNLDTIINGKKYTYSFNQSVRDSGFAKQLLKAQLQAGVSKGITTPKAFNFSTQPGTGFKVVTGYPMMANANVSMDHFADKLFVIDGKIATKHDMKKLSMFDIDHIAVKSSQEMKELYGDKAKDGVVFIVTKKVK